MNRRLITLIVAGIIILGLVALALLWAVNRQNQEQPQVQSGPSLVKVSDNAMVSPIQSFNNNAVWFFSPDGKLFRINTDGTGLEEQPIPSLGLNTNVRRVLWPKNGSDMIVVSLSGSTEVKDFYSNASKIYTRLAPNIQSIDWMPDSRRIAYIWRSADGQSQQLVIANSDGTGFVPVKDVFWPDLQVKVAPTGLSALLYRSQIQGGVNKIYSVDLTSGVITTVVDQGENLSAHWITPTRFLFSQSSVTDYPRIYMYDTSTNKATDLGINTSLDKVVTDFEATTLYVATPKKDNTGDKFVAVDLTSFAITDYFEPEGVVSAKNLLMISTGLYFINTTDNKLYTIMK